MAGIFFIKIMTWALLTTILQGHQAQANFSLDFDCSVDSEWIGFFGWARQDEGLKFRTVYGSPFTRTTMTATVVTIVDRVINSTKVTTSLPPEWTPAPTNAAGTQTRIIEFSESTVTLAFPTVLIRWPTVYTHCPQLNDHGGCVTAVTTAMITSPPPQPTKPFDLTNFSYLDPDKLADPQGLLAMPVVVWGENAWQPVCSQFLGPYYPAFTCTSTADGGPIWGGLDSTWLEISTSISYLDANPTSFSG